MDLSTNQNCKFGKKKTDTVWDSGVPHFRTKPYTLGDMAVDSKLLVKITIFVSSMLVPLRVQPCHVRGSTPILVCQATIVDSVQCPSIAVSTAPFSHVKFTVFPVESSEYGSESFAQEFWSFE